MPGIFDAGVGVVMLAEQQLLAQLFGVSLPTPPIHADLNGLFLLCIAAGYLIPYREPQSSGGRASLWVMGPVLKAAGAAAFVTDYLLRHSPQPCLLSPRRGRGTLLRDSRFFGWRGRRDPYLDAGRSRHAQGRDEGGYLDQGL